MYLCLCRGINEDTVCSAVAAGARKLEDLSAACGAGTGCGGCLPSLRRLLHDLLCGPTEGDPGPGTTSAFGWELEPPPQVAAAVAARPHEHSGATPGTVPGRMLRPGGQPCEEATVSSRCSTRS